MGARRTHRDTLKRHTNNIRDVSLLQSTETNRQLRLDLERVLARLPGVIRSAVLCEDCALGAEGDERHVGRHV